MNRLRKMISHQLPQDTRKPAQMLQSPKLKCDQCDYKTHERSHLLAHAKVQMEKFHCSTCGKQFAGKERLAALEDCQKKGLKCSKCPEVFKTVGAKYWHYQKKHMNKTVRNKVGFFSIDSSFFQQTEAVKKSPKVHQCRSVKGSNFARHKLSNQKPKKEKKIGVYKCVKGCHYYTRNTYNFNRHLESCRRFIITIIFLCDIVVLTVIWNLFFYVSKVVTVMRSQVDHSQNQKI